MPSSLQGNRQGLQVAVSCGLQWRVLFYQAVAGVWFAVVVNRFVVAMGGFFLSVY